MTSVALPDAFDSSTDTFTSDWASWHEARERGTASPFGLASLVATHWLKDTLLLALSDGRVLRWSDGALDTVEAHPGGILSAASDGARLVTGGDDGRPRRRVRRGLGHHLRYCH